MTAEATLQKLIEGGVVVRSPQSVDIDPSIDPERIARGVVIHAGCRLSGAKTSIAPGCVLGAESPVTIVDCQLGRNVALGGGFFSGATLLDGVTIGDGAHIRPGTLLEDHASGGHCVGLKQTLLMPFVTLGSLVNFCDCLMAGGTGPKNHSEVGSSYIHFNFTAHQDKATPSLIGDVPRGVMLDQPTIFLGGQGGLVGPATIEYGTIVAAGTICRRDVLTPNRLIFGQTGHRVKEHPYDTEVYGGINRILLHNFKYIGNLHALLQWYGYVREHFVHGDVFTRACMDGALGQLKAMLDERLNRLTQLSRKMRVSLEVASSRHQGKLPPKPFDLQRQFAESWDEVSQRIGIADFPQSTPAEADALLTALDSTGESNYIEAMKALSPDAKASGAAWLQSIVDGIVLACKPTGV